MLASNLIEEYNEEIFFDTPVGRLNLIAERNVYNAIRLKYQRLSLEISSDFKEKWNTYESPEEIIDKLEDDLYDFIMEGIGHIKEDLLSCKIFDQDENAIFEEAGKDGSLANIKESFDIFFSKIGEVINNLEQIEAAREMRKNTRGRWTGATISSSDKGFVDSYVDSIKFQMELGARNAIEGIGHSIFNAIGNSISASNARKEIKEICNNTENRDTLIFGLQKSIFNLHITLLRLLNREDIDMLPKEEEVQKATRLLNNADNTVLSYDEKNQLLIDAWQLNPYNENFYMNLIQKDFTNALEVTKISDYFGVDITKQKDEMAREFLNAHLGNTESDAKKAQEELLEYYRVMGIEFSEDLQSYQEIKRILEEFDLDYRTVDSFVCSSRENAEKARDEEIQIKKYMESIQPPTKDSLLDYEVELKNKRKEFEQTFSSELVEKNLKIIDDYIEKFDRFFCGVGILNTQVDRKTAGIVRSVKYAKDLEVACEQDVVNAQMRLKEFLPYVNLTEDDAKEAFEVINKKREKLNNSSSTQKLFGSLGGLFKR